MTRSKVGIVVPPRYFDTTSTELTSLCAEVDVLHTQIRVSPDFGFTLDEIVQTGEEISDCAASLVAAGAEVVLQLGTPFSTAHGWSAGQELQRRTERIGILGIWVNNRRGDYRKGVLTPERIASLEAIVGS